MYYYFSSGYAAALKLNGVYFGVIENNVKACDIDLSSPTLVEVCPLVADERGVNFIIDGDFRGVDGCSVTDLKGGYLIKFERKYAGGEFKVLAQEKYQGGCVTVFNDNGLKLSIETQTEFFADTFQQIPSNATVNFFTLDQEPLCGILLGGDLLFVYTLRNPAKVFERQVDGFSFSNGFTTTENYLDMAKHKVERDWEFKGGRITEKARRVSCSEYFAVDRLPKRLLPFAFLEEFLAGGDIIPYLTGGIKDNADKLGGFLGEFLGIMPPPVFRSIDQVGLVYKERENRYRVDYLTFDFDGDKICNLKKVD